jgi:FkbM family methyltransferase
LEPYFQGQTEGFVVDVGAADGCVNSNTVQLLMKYPNWGGVFIEPDPTQFEALSQHYQGRKNTQCFRYGVGKLCEQKLFYSAGQVSTFSTVWRTRCEEMYKLHFTRVMIESRSLTAILEEARAPFIIDFLSIDCEQMDQEVLDSLDMDKYFVRLICMEGSGHNVPNYKVHGKTHGNTFYIRELL